MTVPAVTSPECETRQHGPCPGYGWDHLRGDWGPCTCHCHPPNGTRYTKPKDRHS